MKAKQETIGMINYLNGLQAGVTVIVGNKSYIFKAEAISKVDAYHSDYYFIVTDLKGNLHVLDSNTLVTIKY